MSQWLCLDFDCPTHGKFEKIVDKRDGANAFATCYAPLEDGYCCELAPRVECYAVTGRMKLGEVSQGRNSDLDRPSHILDTRDLGDGMSRVEWEAKQDKADQDRRHSDVKEMML